MKAQGIARDVALGIVPIALLLALWQAIVAFGYAPQALLPPPTLVFSRMLAQITSSSDFLAQASATLLRLFIGFSIAVILGVGIGLSAAVNRTVGAVVRPIVRVLAPVPKVALYPALLLLLGFGHASKVALVAADALFPILLSTYYGATMVEQKLVWSALAAGTKPHQILFKVVLPAALPSILTGCRIGLVISCIVVFLAEMISSTDGLGYLLVREGASLRVLGFDLRDKLRDLGRGAGVAAAIGGSGLALYLASQAAGYNLTVAPSGLPDVWWRVPVLVLSAWQNAVLEEVVVLGYLLRLRNTLETVA